VKRPDVVEWFLIVAALSLMFVIGVWVAAQMTQ
jgi:hypothetical protein